MNSQRREEAFSITKYFKIVEEEGMEPAIDYRKKFTPDYVYKYIQLTDNDDENNKRFLSLANNQLWFSSCRVQNDPFEYKGIYFDVEKIMGRGVPKESVETAERMLEKMLLCAFSANCETNMPMWAYYANNHKGFCLKYKVNNKRIVNNVVYVPERIPVYGAFFNFFDEIIQESKEDLYKMIMTEKFFVKHVSWASEHEYRALYPNQEDIEGKNIMGNDIGLDLVEILAGYKCSEIHCEKLKNIGNVLGVPYSHCELDEKRFLINIRD